MANITTREVAGTGATVKNSPLTNAELDNNFLALNAELASKPSSSDISTAVDTAVSTAVSTAVNTAVSDKVSKTGDTINGNLTVTGTVTGGIFSGDGSQLTNLPQQTATVDPDTAYLDTQQLWLANQRPFYVSQDITSTSSITYDGAMSQVRKFNLTGSTTITFSAPTNIVVGTMYKFIFFAQDTAARTIAWSTSYKFPGGVSPLTSPSTVSGGYDVISFIGMPGNTLVYQGSVLNVY